MTRQIRSEEEDPIVQAVQRFPNGAKLVEIMAQLHPPIPKRTLQRRLALLCQKGSVQQRGNARSRTYIVGITQAEPIPDISIPLSPEAKAQHAKITLPLHTRTPVGYKRKFLDSYIPNTTFYLPQHLREHLAQAGKVPDGHHPAGTYARLIFNRLLIDLSWNSSRLEGNTYSLLETKRLIELGESSEGKNVKDSQMILNHKAAIEFLINFANHIEINKFTILNLHALLAANLLANPETGGRLRTIPVGIAKSVYHLPEVPQLIEECFTQILHTAHSIHDPFEQAFFLMVHLPYLQPFEDVNKRVSRLAANIPFIRKNLCPLSFVDVPADTYTSSMLTVYELNKVEYLRDVFTWAYERSCRLYSATCATIGEPDLFRFRYRIIIAETILHIVHEHLAPKFALSYIEQCARKQIPAHDQARFISVIDVELASLHEGNIARYRITLEDFRAWKRA